MAYILKINERIIDTKTNLKPFQNQLKKNSKMDYKLYSYELVEETCRNRNSKIMNFSSSDSLFDYFLRIIMFFYLKIKSV